MTQRKTSMQAHRMGRIWGAGAACLSLWAAPLTLAHSASYLTFGVSEGTSGGLDHAQVIAKYEGLAQVLSKALGQKVNVVFVREFKALESGMKDGRFDFVMARPSDYPARALRDDGYRFVASALPDGQCLIVVPKDSKITTLEGIRGQRIAMPEQVSYMSRLCRAEMRDNNVLPAKEQVKYVREQGAVTFYLHNKLVDVGALASYSGAAAKWMQDGQTVLYKGQPQPYFPMIASPKISAAQVAQVQRSLTELGNEDSGQAVLSTIGIQKFDTTSEQRLRKLLPFLEKPETP